MSTPGSIFAGIVLIDEPASLGVTTFANNGEVLLTLNNRPGGDVSQVIIGLTPNMAIQLIQALQQYDDIYARAIAEGKGGARFTSEKSKKSSEKR